MPPYRPQFAYPTPAGSEDMDFDHYFDSKNTPGLNIPPGNVPVRRIPLNIDPDAPFRWRGIKIPMASGLRDMAVRFKDPAGHYLQDGLVPAWLFAVPPTSSNLDGGQSCILESEIECPAGSTVELDVQYSTPQSALGSGPTRMSVTETGLGSYSAVQWGAIQWKSNLWMFVAETIAGVLVTAAYKSENGGTSWSLIDGANSPPSNDAATFWDGLTNAVTVMHNPAMTGSPIALRTFNLDSQTWGSDFATASAPTLVPGSLWRRSDGSWIGLFFDRTDPVTPLYISIFTAGAWTAPLDITTNATALPGWGASGASFKTAPSSVLDSADRLHVLFTTLQSPAGTPNWNARYFYQQITQPGALGPFLDFPGQNVTTLLQDLNPAGNGVAARLQIVGNSLVWGVYRNISGGGAPQVFPAVYVGSPLANPAWVESASLDSNTSSAYRPEGSFPNVFFDPTTGNLYAVWVRGNPLNSSVAVVFAFTRVAGFLTGWQTQVMFDVETSPLGAGLVFYPLIVIGTNGVIVGMSVDISIDALEQRYWIGYPSLEVILTGVKRYPAAGGAQ